jgi:hypothetical protein
MAGNGPQHKNYYDGVVLATGAHTGSGTSGSQAAGGTAPGQSHDTLKQTENTGLADLSANPTGISSSVTSLMGIGDAAESTRLAVQAVGDATPTTITANNSSNTAQTNPAPAQTSTTSSTSGDSPGSPSGGSNAGGGSGGGGGNGTGASTTASGAPDPNDGRNKTAQTPSLAKSNNTPNPLLGKILEQLERCNEALSGTRSGDIAGHIGKLTEAIEKSGTITQNQLAELIAKVSQHQTAKLDQVQLDKITAAIEKLENQQSAANSHLATLAPIVPQLFSLLLDQLKDLKQAIANQTKANQPAPAPATALQNEISEADSAVKDLRNALETYHKAAGMRLRVRANADTVVTINGAPETCLKGTDLYKLATAVCEKVEKLRTEVITHASNPASDARPNLNALAHLTDQMDWLNHHAANFISRSDELFARNKGIKQQRISIDQINITVQDPLTGIDKVISVNLVQQLHALNRSMHQCVEEIAMRHPDAMSLPGAVSKLGQTEILSMLDDRSPRGTSCYQILAEMHSRGWLTLSQLHETGSKLSFKYAGLHQTNERLINTTPASKVGWSLIAWGTAVSGPALAFVLGVTTGPFGACAALLGAGALGVSLDKTAKTVLNKKFEVELKKNAIGQAFTPERMIAEGIGVLKSMQVLSKQVGVLNTGILPVGGARESNDPYELSASPTIGAVKRAVIGFNSVARGSSTDQRSARFEYEEGLKTVIPSIPALTGGWARYLQPALQICRLQFGFGATGVFGSGIRLLFGSL